MKEYQLWVISKKDNVPYPLIGQWFLSQCAPATVGPARENYCQPPPKFLSLSGHEFPFSIQMSHVIQTLSQRGEGRTAAAASGAQQVALQMEQLQAYKHCQFILKPRPTDLLPGPAGRLCFRAP